MTGEMYSDQEKLIFAYEVRGQKRWADPLAVRRELLRATQGRWDELRRRAGEQPDDPPTAVRATRDEPEEIAQARAAAVLLGALQAEEDVLAAVRHAFGLAPFDPTTGQGACEQEVWGVLDAFDGWMEKNASAAAN